MPQRSIVRKRVFVDYGRFDGSKWSTSIDISYIRKCYTGKIHEDMQTLWKLIVIVGKMKYVNKSPRSSYSESRPQGL